MCHVDDLRAVVLLHLNTYKLKMYVLLPSKQKKTEQYHLHLPKNCIVVVDVNVKDVGVTVCVHVFVITGTSFAVSSSRDAS